MSKIPEDHGGYDMDDATIKDLILDTACRVHAIQELLNEKHHKCEYTSKHDMSDVLLKTEEVDGRTASIKAREPYKSGLKSTNAHGSPSHSAITYLRAFLRNLFDPK